MEENENASSGQPLSEAAMSPEEKRAAFLYLGLLKKCLVRWFTREYYEDITDKFMHSPQEKEMWVAEKQKVIIVKNFELEKVMLGLQTNPEAETMVGIKRLDNIQKCLMTILRENIPGDLAETGVWGGGAVIFMKGVLKVFGDNERVVWAADCFDAGFPKPNIEKYPMDAMYQDWKNPQFIMPLERVKENFTRYDLLDDRVRFLKGRFCDTLPSAPINKLSLLRLDGDMYESTTDALEALYPKLSVGGFIIIDDLSHPNCAAAVKDYRDRNGITEEIIPVDWTAQYWRKTKEI